MMRFIRPALLPLQWLSTLGLILSVLVHLGALLGTDSALGEAAWFLHGGIFLVWFPAVLVLQPLTREFKQKDLWRAALRGCPTWMRWMTYGFFGYAAVNFILFIFMVPGRHASPDTPPIVLRGFSGHWMAFYSAAVAIFYSARHAEEHDQGRRCPSGHQVGPLARYCEECGRQVLPAAR
jgi:hypothetical protein